jgi:hypothetical protein
LDVAEVLEIFRRRTLLAQRPRSEFGRQEVGFPGLHLSQEGVSADPHKAQSMVEHKAQSMVERATPTSCARVRRFAGRASYCCLLVHGYSELWRWNRVDSCGAREPRGRKLPPSSGGDPDAAGR